MAPVDGAHHEAAQGPNARPAGRTVTARLVVWTDTERALLHRVPIDIGHCIADPDDAIDYFRNGSNAAWGPGHHRRFTATSLYGEWTDTTGPHTATITYTRLRRWCEGLPSDIRAQALTLYRTYPVNTRDLPALARLAVAAINAGTPKPQPGPELLALFELT